MIMALLLIAASLMTVWLLLHAVRVDGQMTERLNRMRADIERARKQAEVMAQNRTPDDAVDRLDRGDF